jgi:hypothetical protein
MGKEGQALVSSKFNNIKMAKQSIEFLDKKCVE